MSRRQWTVSEHRPLPWQPLVPNGADPDRCSALAGPVAEDADAVRRAVIEDAAPTVRAFAPGRPAYAAYTRRAWQELVGRARRPGRISLSQA